MTVTELKNKLQGIEDEGYGKLIIAYCDDSTNEVNSCDICLSVDGVGQYVEVR